MLVVTAGQLTVTSPGFSVFTIEAEAGTTGGRTPMYAVSVRGMPAVPSVA